MRKIDNEKSMLSFSTFCAKKSFVVSPVESDNQIGLDGRMRWVKSSESNYSDNELMRFTVSFGVPNSQGMPLEMRKTALM